jgi:hypothetical protein
MTEPNISERDGRDAEAWRRVLSSAALLDVVAAAVQDWTPVSAVDAAWLTHTALPAGWRVIPAKLVVRMY